MKKYIGMAGIFIGVALIVLTPFLHVYNSKVTGIEDNARKEAEKYIKKKYHFDLEIVKSDVHINRFNSSYVDAIYEAKHDGKTYYVTLESEHGDYYVSDTYQNKEIAESYAKELEKIYGDKIYYFYSSLEDKNRNSYTKLFTGNNYIDFEDFLFVAVFVNNENFNSDTTSKVLNLNYPNEFYIYNFKSEEAVNKLKNVLPKIVKGEFFDKDRVKSDLPLIYSRDFLELKSYTNEVLYKVEIDNNGDVIFAKNNYNTGTSNNIYEYQKHELTKQGTDFIKGKYGSNVKVLESYNVGKSEMDKQYVFIKKEKVSGKDLKALLYCSYNEYYGNNMYEEAEVIDAGDYWFIEFNGLYCTDDLYFTVVGK